MKVLLPQYLVEPPFGAAPVVMPNDSFVAGIESGPTAVTGSTPEVSVEVVPMLAAVDGDMLRQPMPTMIRRPYDERTHRSRVTTKTCG